MKQVLYKYHTFVSYLGSDNYYNYAYRISLNGRGGWGWALKPNILMQNVASVPQNWMGRMEMKEGEMREGSCSPKPSHLIL